LIVFGVDEQASDTDKDAAAKLAVNKLIEDIGVEVTTVTDCKITRFKSKDTNKPGRILIECKSIEDKLEILKHAKNLKGKEEYKQVFINNDLTTAQLDNEKRLRIERNKKNEALEQTGPNGLKYGLQTSTDGNQFKFYWGIRNGELKRIKSL
jgi:cell division protein FtsI/penicillin-binding protein 2